VRPVPVYGNAIGPDGITFPTSERSHSLTFDGLFRLVRLLCWLVLRFRFALTWFDCLLPLPSGLGCSPRGLFPSWGLEVSLTLARPGVAV